MRECSREENQDRQQGQQDEEERRPAAGRNDHAGDEDSGLAGRLAGAIDDAHRPQGAVRELAIALVDQ